MKRFATIYDTHDCGCYVTTLGSALARAKHHAFEVGSRQAVKADRFTRIRLFCTTLRRELQTLYDVHTRDAICDVYLWSDAGELEPNCEIRRPKSKKFPRPELKITTEELREAVMAMNAHEIKEPEIISLKGELDISVAVGKELLDQMNRVVIKSAASADKINDLCNRIMES